MDPTIRLRLATRIHYGMRRRMEIGIDVGRMLGDSQYAREVIYVCQGSGDEELRTLAEQFQAPEKPAAKPRPMTAKMRVMPTPQEQRQAALPPPPQPKVAESLEPASDDTLEELEEDPFAKPMAIPKWINPMHWLRRRKPGDGSM